MHLLKAHAGEIYFAMDAVPVTASDFQILPKFGMRRNKANRLKKRKWSELNLETNFNAIFGPHDDGSEEKEICKVCGSFGSLRPINTKKLEEDEIRICRLCDSFIDLTNESKNADYILFKKVSNSQNNNYERYQDIFRHFGYDIRFCRNLPNTIKEGDDCYSINDTEFLKKNCSGFHFGAMNCPLALKARSF